MFHEPVVEPAALVNHDTKIESAGVYTVVTSTFRLLRKDGYVMMSIY